MADLDSQIETLEHQAMRAWIAHDRPALKKIATRDFRFVLGSRPAVLLDRASFLAAERGQWACNAYRFLDIHTRKHGGAAIFAASVELQMSVDREDWSGQFWMVDLWRKGRVRRGWNLAERSLARIEKDEAPPKALTSLQLWT